MPNDKKITVDQLETTARVINEEMDEQNRIQDESLEAHTGNKNNPHGVTAIQVGAIPIDGEGMTNEQRETFRAGIGAANVILKTWTAADLG